jgi:hypothetical protein
MQFVVLFVHTLVLGAIIDFVVLQKVCRKNLPNRLSMSTNAEKMKQSVGFKVQSFPFLYCVFRKIYSGS